MEGRAQVVNVVGGFGLSWQAAFGVITLLYFYSHYLFASGAAHIGAMYTAFLSVAIACGALWTFLCSGVLRDLLPCKMSGACLWFLASCRCLATALGSSQRCMSGEQGAEGRLCSFSISCSPRRVWSGGPWSARVSCHASPLRSSARHPETCPVHLAWACHLQAWGLRN